MTAFDGVNRTVCNAQQYQQSLQSYGSRTPWISCLTYGDIIGLVFVAEASSVSCICVIIIFICIVRNVHWYKKTIPNGSWKLFQEPSDIYMFSLFAFDFLQAVGGILDARWASTGIVTTGTYCTVQGLIEQFGELGVALITLLLAIHTFVAAVLPVNVKARGVAFGMVCLACVFIMLWVAIGGSIHKNYETPTPYWCWIGPRYPRERLGGETIWMWIALFASVILYIPLYFWAEGHWSVDEGYRFRWWKFDQRVEYAQRRAALRMLLYPLAYSLVILPLTIARCLTFNHHHVPSAVTFFATSVFYLSGAINVVLFLIIRPELLLFPRRKELEDKDTGPAILSDTAEFQHSPEPTSDALGDGRDSPTPSHVRPRRISDDI